MTVQIESGDLLKEKSDAIVNTVNCVGVMGKGIALQFKQRWPSNFRAYEAASRRKEIKTGRVFIYDLGEWEKPRYIINFPTKVHWRGDSKLEYIQDGLRDLVKQLKRLGIKSIALPPLGCGNGGLDWDDVRELILAAFKDYPNMNVHLYEPKGAPPPREMAIRTKKPNMTAVRAAIIKVISIYREMEYGLSKIEVQKLAYFLEKAGQPLNLEFVKQSYGPYSDKLRHVLKGLDGHYIIGVGDFAEEADIGVVPGAVDEADEFIRTSGDEGLANQVERVRNLIQGFETPYGMELLATVHWVATQEPNIRTVDEVVKAVHNWNARKRAILRENHIRLAWERLRDQGWLRPLPQTKKGRLSFEGEKEN
ncbi:MAG TPA: macro domain-containing protein [Candidatus Acidoferrum sp.]|nr:macro domain-containing protein [Candidatus Acidoferrum sp.]